MKTMNLTKKVAALFLTIALACTLVVPAFAAGEGYGIQPLDSGNGWTSSTVTKNGVSYTVYASAAFDSSSNGGYTGLQTSCRCTRTHSIVTMNYLSVSDGNLVARSPGNAVFSEATGTTVSHKATPSSTSVFKSLLSITGTITVKVTNQDGFATSYNFNPRLSNG